MKNYKAQNLLQLVDKLNDLSGFTFAMAIAKAKKLLMEEQEILNNIVKPSKEYEKLLEESRNIYKKYALKNEDGTIKTKTVNNQDIFDIDKTKIKELKDEIAKLEKKNKALIEEQSAKNVEYEKAMQEESTFLPFEISEKQMPKNITVEQMEIALYFLKIKS